VPVRGLLPVNRRAFLVNLLVWKLVLVGILLLSNFDCLLPAKELLFLP